MDDFARVRSFYDDDADCEMVLLSVSETGLCKCLYENAHEGVTVRVARHRNRVTPLNDKAREMLRGT